MKKLIILLAPDESGGGGSDDTPSEKGGKPTSKDIVIGGDEKRIKKLETHISELQDKRKEDLGIIAELKKTVEALPKIPSARKPGKTLLDEVDEFLGFGTNETANTTEQV